VEREQYWQGVIRDQEASGRSISAFCREGKVPMSSFFSWRRKLADRHRKRIAERADTAGKFVSIELPPPAAAQSNCEVVLPDGCRIIVPARFDAGSLREILSALRERPC
jgi:hypothetical protein